MIYNLIDHLLSWLLHEPQGILKTTPLCYGEKNHPYQEVWVNNILAKLDLNVNWPHHLEAVLVSSSVDFFQFPWHTDIHSCSPWKSAARCVLVQRFSKVVYSTNIRGQHLIGISKRPKEFSTSNPPECSVGLGFSLFFSGSTLISSQEMPFPVAFTAHCPLLPQGTQRAGWGS